MASTSILGKLWDWLKGEVVHVEAGIEEVFGSSVAQSIESAGKALLESNFGPVIATALADATDVATGQMSVSKAISGLVTGMEAAGKSITSAAALQIIGVAQNALPVKAATVTPTA